MTYRRIRCSNPDCPHEQALYFSDWIREKLPESKGKFGFSAYDIDFVLHNRRTRRMMLIELKTRGAIPKFGQNEEIKRLDSIFKKAYSNERYREYLGYHLIVFSNTSFNDGICFLDGKEISEESLIEYLSMDGA